MSILSDIKKALEVPEDETFFNTDMLIHINSAFANVFVLGAGPSTGFFLVLDAEPEQLWSAFGDETLPVTNFVKQYIYLSAKMVFDPPKTSFTTTSYVNTINKLEDMIKNESGGWT